MSTIIAAIKPLSDRSPNYSTAFGPKPALFAIKWPFEIPSLPELVGRILRHDAPYVEQAAGDELAQNQAVEERQGGGEGTHPAVAQQHDLGEPGDEQGQPEQVHLP